MLLQIVSDLHLEHGNPVRALGLAADADPNAKTRVGGLTPLLYAVSGAGTDAIAFLLKAGSDPKYEGRRKDAHPCTSRQGTTSPRLPPRYSSPVSAPTRRTTAEEHPLHEAAESKFADPGGAIAATIAVLLKGGATQEREEDEPLQ